MKSPLKSIVFSCLFSTLLCPIIAKPLVNEIDSVTLKKLPLKWKQRIGLTTYRTTLQYADGKIFAPSNGKDTKSLNDRYDGVHILDAKTGKILNQLTQGSFGDRDVNGVAVSNSKIVFGNDEHTLSAFDWKGNLLWDYTATSDFEGAPALTKLNNDAILDVISSTEDGTLLAIDGLTGTKLWEFKPAINPTQVYPKTRNFLASPALLDINKDTIKDCVIGNRNGILYVLDGSNGKILWKHISSIPSGIIASPIITNKTIFYAESYGIIHKLSARGRIMNQFSLPETTAFQVTSTPLMLKNMPLLIGATNTTTSQGLWVISLPKRPIKIFEGNISSSPILANIDTTPDPEFIITTESGWLLVIDTNGTLIGKYKLLTGTECTPLIADIDNDGKLELVLALNDQYIYAYDLPSKGPVIWGQLRANPYNTGTENDTLSEDAPLTNLPHRSNLYPPQSPLTGFIVDNWFSKPVIENRISTTTIGHAQLGMTLGQYKLKMPYAFKSKEVTLENGLKSIAIIINNSVEYYLIFPQYRPITDQSIINAIVTNNPKYKTKSGISSGTPIRIVSTLLGSPTFSFNRNYPLEEKCRFNDQPRWLVFTSYSKVKAGIYSRGNTITRNYKPEATLQFIGIR